MLIYDELGTVWCGPVRWGSMRYGKVGSGVVGCGIARHVLVRFGVVGITEKWSETKYI